MAIDTTVLTKIKKLLALSTSSNPNEAASAAAKAQELLMQHNLTMSQIETHGQESQYCEAFVNTGSRVWRRLLLTAIAQYTLSRLCTCTPVNNVNNEAHFSKG
jgi:hypothetical protein